jgi:hypothetical protein
MKFSEQNTVDLGNLLKVIIHQGFWNVMLCTGKLTGLLAAGEEGTAIP